MRLRSVGYIAGLVTALVVVAVASLLFVPDLTQNLIRRTLEYVGKQATVASKKIAPQLLAERKTNKCVWLEQNWSDADRAWVHNVSQGTATFPVPYAWFRQLERPELRLSSPGLISDVNYLARLGFIAPDKSCDPVGGPDMPEGYGALPAGFAVLKGGIDPATGKAMDDGLGLTCAACHTGRVIYKGTELRIDGAPAMIDLGNLERLLGLSICYTYKFPLRAERFAQAVLGADASGADKKELSARLGTLCDEKVFGKVVAEQNLLDRRQQAHAEEGFGRLDALNRIGNQVFHENLADPTDISRPAVKEDAGGLSQAKFEANFAAHSAPVSFPPLWDVPHFSWAQYDASILSPSIRNIGEAMGVSARINMTDANDPSRPLFSSTVKVDAIARIEALLRGKEHPLDGEVGFKGLRAPKWEEAATHFPDDENWKIDAVKKKAGREIYRVLCVECHRAPPGDDEVAPGDSFWSKVDTGKDARFPDDANWITIKDERLYNVVQKSVADIGTDPEQARVLTERQIALPKYLGMNTQRDLLDACGIEGDSTLGTSYAVGLMAIVQKVQDRWFLDKTASDGHPMPPDQVLGMKGTRPNCPNPRVFRPMNPKTESDTTNAPGNALKVTYMTVPHYRARPLDGVWATAPYLHNGSVPTLEDLLVPQAARPPIFCVGPVEFDPVRVGLPVNRDPEAKPECETGLTTFDVTARGNSNRGHSFEGADGAALPRGVIGRELTSTERENLIVYLKSL